MVEQRIAAAVEQPLPQPCPVTRRVDSSVGHSKTPPLTDRAQQTLGKARVPCNAALCRPRNGRAQWRFGTGMHEEKDDGPLDEVAEALDEGGLIEPVAVRRHGHWHRAWRITQFGLLAFLL